jgi:hypothetical protein
MILELSFDTSSITIEVLYAAGIGKSTFPP